MTTSKKYYLFKSGRLYGPLTEEKLTTLRTSGEIAKYSWIIDETQQKWQPVETAPQDNPFAASAQSAKDRDLSGAFIFGKNPHLGAVRGLHAFGVDLLVPAGSAKIAGLQPNTVLQLNLADESDAQSMNTEVVFQQAEEQPDGVLIRFAWVHGPAQL